MTPPPFRADHVGSLLRPAALRQAFRDHAAGRIDNATFGQIQDKAIEDAPSGVVFAIHMCRGNFKGRYLSSGGYDDVAEQLFERAEVGHFLLEYDTPRAGDFSPLRHVPRNKGVVLGLVSSKVPALEPVDLLRRGIDEASRHVDVGRLAISPQCGFASTAAGNPLSEADMRAKLARCVEVANIVWS